MCEGDVAGLRARGGRGGGMSQNVVQNVAGGGEITDTIALGKVSIRANVGVTFELKK